MTNNPPKTAHQNSLHTLQTTLTKLLTPTTTTQQTLQNTLRAHKHLLQYLHSTTTKHPPRLHESLSAKARRLQYYILCYKKWMRDVASIQRGLLFLRRGLEIDICVSSNEEGRRSRRWREICLLYENSVESFEECLEGIDDGDGGICWDVEGRGGYGGVMGVLDVGGLVRGVKGRVGVLRGWGGEVERWEKRFGWGVKGDRFLKGVVERDGVCCGCWDVGGLMGVYEEYGKVLEFYERFWKECGGWKGRGRRKVVEEVCGVVKSRMEELGGWFKLWGGVVCQEKAEGLMREGRSEEDKVRRLFLGKDVENGDGEVFSEAAWTRYASAVKYYNIAGKFELDARKRNELDSMKKECCELFDNQDENRLALVKSQ